MEIQKSIKNATLISSGLLPFQSNVPSQYRDKQHEYIAPETKTYIEKVARFSNDFILARVQTDVANNIWDNFFIRMADVVSPSASITRRFDNYKAVLFADRSIQYIQPGTKIECMGSTWLCTNPINISGGDGAGIVQRCNATWNHLDWYGNLLKEPIVVENQRANASDSDSQSSMYIAKGYFNATCQYNEWTAQLDTNSRLILGKGAYRITGYSDFHEEFTGDFESQRILEFVIRYIEPNPSIDDMENHVAEGKSFIWEINVKGTVNATVGQQVAFGANSFRNNISVQNTEEYPISYLWSSSDESVAVVDEDGNVECVGAGTANIVATLEQNPSITGSLELTVEEQGTETGVFFTSNVPDTLSAFEDIAISAAYFENGEQQFEELTFTFSGADADSYRAIAGPMGINLYCFGYSATPLTIKASYGNYSVSKSIQLVGM